MVMISSTGRQRRSRSGWKRRESKAFLLYACLFRRGSFPRHIPPASLIDPAPSLPSTSASQPSPLSSQHPTGVVLSACLLCRQLRRLVLTHLRIDGLLMRGGAQTLLASNGRADTSRPLPLQQLRCNDSFSLNKSNFSKLSP